MNATEMHSRATMPIGTIRTVDLKADPAFYRNYGIYLKESNFLFRVNGSPVNVKFFVHDVDKHSMAAGVGIRPGDVFLDMACDFPKSISPHHQNTIKRATKNGNSMARDVSPYRERIMERRTIDLSQCNIEMFERFLSLTSACTTKVIFIDAHEWDRLTRLKQKLEREHLEKSTAFSTTARAVEMMEAGANNDLDSSFSSTSSKRRPSIPSVLTKPFSRRSSDGTLKKMWSSQSNLLGGSSNSQCLKSPAKLSKSKMIRTGSTSSIPPAQSPVPGKDSQRQNGAFVDHAATLPRKLKLNETHSSSDVAADHLRAPPVRAPPPQTSTCMSFSRINISGSQQSINGASHPPSIRLSQSSTFATGSNLSLNSSASEHLLHSARSEPEHHEVSSSNGSLQRPGMDRIWRRPERLPVIPVRPLPDPPPAAEFQSAVAVTATVVDDAAGSEEVFHEETTRDPQVHTPAAPPISYRFYETPL